MTDGEKFALKRRLKERYAWDKRRVYEIAEEEINSMKKTPTIAEILDKISAEIEASMYCDKDTRLVENANASGLKKALEIIEKYKGNSE